MTYYKYFLQKSKHFNHLGATILSKALYDELKNIDLLKLQIKPEKLDNEED